MVAVVSSARGNEPSCAMCRREVTHKDKDYPRGELGSVSHIPTNTTARTRMEVPPVKGVGRIRRPADVPERLPESDVHHCAPGV